jgi:hypothetical protein
MADPVEPEQYSAKLSTWLMYGVAAGLIPILFVVILRGADGQSIRPTAILSSGDLILISVVLVIGAFGDLLLSQEGRPWSVFARAMAFSAWLVTIVGSLLYGDIAKKSLEQTSRDLKTQYGPHAAADDLVAAYDASHSGVMWQSLFVFGVSVAVGFAMVRLRSLESAR